jgi:hypothetical protein
MLTDISDYGNIQKILIILQKNSMEDVLEHELMYTEYKVSFGSDINCSNDAITVATKSRREAAKLYGLVLHHKGILNKLGGDPCYVRVQESENLDERGQYFKLWSATEKIYAECFISPQTVSIC